MSQIVIQQEFAVSASRVFDALADQDGMSAWMRNKITVPVRGANGLVGTVRRIHLGPLTFDERIVEAERPRSIGYQISSPVPLLAHHFGQLVIEALGDRQSRVIWTVKLELKPAFVGAFVRPGLQLVLTAALKRLAKRLHGDGE